MDIIAREKLENMIEDYNEYAYFKLINLRKYILTNSKNALENYERLSDLVDKLTDDIINLSHEIDVRILFEIKQDNISHLVLRTENLN